MKKNFFSYQIRIFWTSNGKVRLGKLAFDELWSALLTACSLCRIFITNVPHILRYLASSRSEMHSRASALACVLKGWSSVFTDSSWKTWVVRCSHAIASHYLVFHAASVWPDIVQSTWRSRDQNCTIYCIMENESPSSVESERQTNKR